MNEIINYLKSKYHPTGILVCGSYADGTNQPSSDFDVMLLYHGSECLYDDSTVSGVQLDAYIYPASNISECDISEFIRIRDGKIIMDDEGTLHELQNKVRSFIDNLPKKTPSENLKNLSWCNKMLLRIKQNHTDSLYRKYWLLTDSPEIFFDFIGEYYPGPKKALKAMECRYPEAFSVYRQALENPTFESIKSWIDYLGNQLDTKQ